MNITDGKTASADCKQLQLTLDDMIDALDEADRMTVVMRFLEGRSFANVSTALRLTENAARMRVESALDQLNAKLVRQGIYLTNAAVGWALERQTSTVAPAGLAASVTATALAGGTAVARPADGRVASVGAITRLISTIKVLVRRGAASVQSNR